MATVCSLYVGMSPADRFVRRVFAGMLPVCGDEPLFSTAVFCSAVGADLCAWISLGVSLEYLLYCFYISRG